MNDRYQERELHDEDLDGAYDEGYAGGYYDDYAVAEQRLMAEVRAGRLLATDDGRYTTWEMTRADRECVRDRPTPAVLLGEMTATSDFPAGVLNIVTGLTGELATTLATHEDVDGLDLGGIQGDEADQLAAQAAQSIKRVHRPTESDTADTTRRLRAFLESSTVWHTIGQ